MNDVWHWILTIILFILSFGLLIVIHELGHFSMAKLFKVYCQEFSVGFGPKLLRVRKKGHETYFAIRAIPLGGYVSMYGEDIELEDGVTIPKERSLEGIKRWKKAIIMVAGITLNALLALTLFAISNIAFPKIYVTTYLHVSENSTITNLVDNDKIQPIGPSAASDKRVTIYDNIVYTNEDGSKETKTYAGSFYILNDDVEYDGNKYVLCWAPNANNYEPKLIDSLSLFLADSTGQIAKTKTFKEWEETYNYKLTNYPDVTHKFNAYSGVNVDVSMDVVSEDNTVKNVTFKMESVDDGNGNFSFKDLGVTNKLQEYWLPFGERVQNTFSDFGSASVAVFQGLGQLFTGGFKNLSGVVGIFQMSANVLSNYTFATYLYFWGLISVNLAIFNLLPFPGLDGWALLVTGVEGAVNAIKRKRFNAAHENDEYVEWKIPSKVKNIVSMIGLIILFILMFVIVGFDIARIVG